MASNTHEPTMADEQPRASSKAGRKATFAAPRTSADETGREDVRDGLDDSDQRDGDPNRERDINNSDRELSDDERFALFQSSIVQSVLPNLPQMNGYHVCWLTLNNPRDTIAMRQQLGYELITHSMVPRWKGDYLKSGELKGVISVNEMVAARIPIRLYNRYMKEVHETLPRAEEEKLRAVVTGLKNQAETVGTRIAEEGDGTADIVQRARPMPEFTA